MSQAVKLTLIFGAIGVAAFIALVLRQIERESFHCPSTLAEIRQSLSGKTVADLRLDNGEATCLFGHMAKELEIVDQEGRF